MQSYAVNDGYCTTQPVNNCPVNATDFYRYIIGPAGLILTSTGGGAGVSGGGGGDVNGDGVEDVVFRAAIYKHTSSTTWGPTQRYITTCIGGTECSELPFQSTDWTAAFIGAQDLLQTGAAVGSYNLAGVDYTAPINVDGSLIAAQNTTMPWTNPPIPNAKPSLAAKAMDVTGDGVGGAAGYAPTGYDPTTAVPAGSTGTWNVALIGAGSFPDRLQSVTDGNGLTTRWTYTSGNDQSVVSAGPRLAYPTKNVHLTTPVVSRMSVDADSSQAAGKTLDTTYTYSGMRMDLRGRGSLGFEIVKSTEMVTDTSTGVATPVVTTTQYSQSFPTIARTVAVTKTGGGVTLHSETSNWASFSTQPGVLYPYVRNQVTSGQDLDGTWLPLVTMQVGTPGGSDGIDVYGNVITSKTTTTENNGAGDKYEAVHSCAAYDNRVLTQWMLGLCTSSTQTVSPANPNAPAGRQQTAGFDAFGALQWTTSMPGSTLALTTTYVPDGNTGLPMTIKKAWTDPLDGSAKETSVSMTYDSVWRFVVTMTNALNQTERHGYDSATGVKTMLNDVNHLTTSWKVDAWGRHTEEDRPDGTYSTMAHRKCVDACGSLAKTVEIVQHWAPGAVQMLAPEETMSDSRGRKLLARTWNDANVEADTTWSYGDGGDLISQTLPKYTSDTATSTTTYTWIDILHRPKRVDRPKASGSGVDSTLYAYSALMTTITDANLHTRSQLLNALGKVKKVTDNNGKAVNYAYDGFGDLLSTTDPVGNVVSMAYDAMGHKTSMQDPDLGSWSYVVDAAGRTRQQTDAKSQVTKYTYDLLDRLTKRVEPDQEGDWLFDSAPNGVGKLAESYTWIAATSTKDYRHVYAYDSLSRPSSSTTTLDWDYTELNTYDNFGHLATVTHRRSAVGAANVANNPTWTGTGTKFVPIAIDDDLSIVVPVKTNVSSGQFGLPEIQYALGYNTQGAVSSVMRGSTTLWTLNAQDAAGRTRSATFGNGLTTATHYNDYTALLDSIQTGPGNGSGANATMQSDTYDYDPVGNLLHRSWLPASGATAMSETFFYDELDRLKSSQVSGLDLKSFGYDALGNITSKTNVGGYAYSCPSGAHAHLVCKITGTVAGLTDPGFSYDANGNTFNGLNRQYAWSAANLPVSVDVLSDGTPASATLRHEFMYGPERDRTREIVRTMSGTTIGAVQRTIYTAGSIEKEIDAVAGTTKIRTYLPLGLGFTEEDFTGTAISPTSAGTPVERYVHKDNLGSIDVVTDASQTVMQRMAYDPWGRRRQSNGLEVGWQYLNAQSATNTLDHKGYTGQEQLDDLSLVHLNGRVYDPMTGRFTSPDPTIPDPYDLQSLNRASYVRNSPMDKVDPTGFSDTWTAIERKDHIADAATAGVRINQIADHSHDKKDPEPTKMTGTANPTGTKAAPPTDAKGGCGNSCAVTGAEDGLHGLPSSTPRDTQQQIDQVANGVAARGAPVAVATALLPEVVMSLASNPLGRAFLTMVGINLNLQAASDGLPVGGGGMVTVGRWMSREELALMQSTGRVVEGAGGSTYVATSGAQSFMRQAQPGSVYVEFGVPKTSLLQGGQADWFKMIGPSAPRSMQFMLQKQGGEMLPKVQNLSDVLVTK
jgi:RHS repeat-associated protein